MNIVTLSSSLLINNARRIFIFIFTILQAVLGHMEEWVEFEYTRIEKKWNHVYRAKSMGTYKMIKKYAHCTVNKMFI